MCCSTAHLQEQWMCRVEFCLIFSTSSVPASGAVNSWNIFHQENGTVFNCDLMSLTARLRHWLKAQCLCSFFLCWEQEKQQTASGRTFPGTPNQEHVSTSADFYGFYKQNWAGQMGAGMMVIVTPASPHTTVSAGVAADDLRLGLLQFFATKHLTYSDSEYLRQSLTSVKGEAAQDLSKLCPWCWHLPSRDLSELISVFQQAALSTLSCLICPC